MSTNYILANYTIRERIGFLNIAYANSEKVILQSDICCRLITYYLLNNTGDYIAMTSMGGNQLFGENEDDGWRFTDVTDRWIVSFREKYGMA